MLTPETTALCLIDIQGKLAQLMHEKEELFANLQRLVKGAQLLGLPILWCEQNPKGLGPTIPELTELLPEHTPISKVSFSCCGESEFEDALKSSKCNTVLLAGIETHVCVYQTAIDLLSKDIKVEVVADAVSSRSSANKVIGLQRMRDAGVQWTCTEMALFELQRMGTGDQFKQLLKVIK